MIKVEIKDKSVEVMVDGEGPRLIVELCLAAGHINEAMRNGCSTQEEKEQITSFILEGIAFALCTEAEREEILKKEGV